MEYPPLFAGTVYAFDVDSLKTLDGYNTFHDGKSEYTTGPNRYFYVEKVTFDESLINDYFTNTSDLTVSDKGNYTYYFEDNVLSLYGYQEIVEIDSANYMISINQNSKLSPSEVNGFLSDIQEFNKLNNLENIECAI